RAPDLDGELFPLRRVLRVTLALAQLLELPLEIGSALPHDAPQLLRLAAELFIRQRLEIVRDVVDLVDDRPELLRLALVAVAEHLRYQRLEHGLVGSCEREWSIPVATLRLRSGSKHLNRPAGRTARARGSAAPRRPAPGSGSVHRRKPAGVCPLTTDRCVSPRRARRPALPKREGRMFPPRARAAPSRPRPRHYRRRCARAPRA